LNPYQESKQYFKTALQEFQFYNKYSRFDWSKMRRETWTETIDRAVSFLRELSQNKLSGETYQRIRQFMLEMKAMPSMRLLAMAGKSARRDNVTIYNCSYLTIDSLSAFQEILRISMSGCGVGFSVESKYTSRLPNVERIRDNVSMYKVDDSSEGWYKALDYGIRTWFEGNDVMFDFSGLRPAGSILKIKGGRASGPYALKRCLDFCRQTIRNASGRKLSSIECHDICCAIGDCAVSGGVRRTAMISLFDWSDNEMRNAKTGNFPSIRWNANNSIVWPDNIKIEQFAQQFLDMHTSCNGEPGIFNRSAVWNTLPNTREIDKDFGINPCGEIILKPMQFCNLSMAIARKDDKLKDLIEKVEIATIIGTIQSMATDFHGLRPEWKKNCESERLIGVDITGQMDCKTIQNRNAMRCLQRVAFKTNEIYAKELGINKAASVTCAKPSGNSSVLFDCSPGIHTRWSDYYIRNVRISATSPLFKVLQKCDVPMNPENGQTKENATTWVISFPYKSPQGSITRNDKTAIEQCEYWLLVKMNFTTHNPSCTITYKPHELLDLMQWVWEHKDVVSGLSFLPDSDAQYEQMPYIEISKEEYERLNAEFPEIDFSLIERFEKEDQTTVAQEVACSANGCELI
jgi:ribonucleoside-diphosphate reductase alpha chain